MYKAFGIINSAGRNAWVDGMQDYRPIGAFSFLGRYRVIDFPISNMSNSDIDRIQIYADRKPRSLIEHLGTGRHYNINSKSGKLQIMFAEDGVDNNYNTDISSYLYNIEYIERMHHPYVVILPENMIFSADLSVLLKTHIDSEADITLLYHSVDNAKDAYLGCNCLNLNKQKGVLGLEANRGSAKNRNVFMDTYVMKKDLFLDLIHKAKNLSSMYTLADIVNISCSELDVRGVAHRGFFAVINDFKSYFNANQALIDIKTAVSLFDNDNWPVFTRTNDSCPTRYFDTANVTSSVISNNCLIEGTLENCVVGRGCIIKKGAVVKNCVLLAGTTVGENVHLENQVADKGAQILRVKEVVSRPENPGYIRRGDTI